MSGPPGLDADDLADKGEDEGVIIEPGRVAYAGPGRPANHFRLGFSSIATERIEPGIRLLADIIKRELAI